MRAKTKNQILLTVSAILLVVMAFLAFSLYDLNLSKSYSAAWNKFWLPVITNLLASLVIVAFSFLFLQHLIHDDDEVSSNALLAAKIKLEICGEFESYKRGVDQTLEAHLEKIAKALSELNISVMDALSEEVHHSSLLRANELLDAFTNFQSNQSNRETPRTILTEENSKQRKRNTSTKYER